jgi:hypothetical protein
MVLATVLKIRRTLTGEEIDDVIATALAEQSLAIERCWRADWRKRELAASSFEAV